MTTLRTTTVRLAAFGITPARDAETVAIDDVTSAFDARARALGVDPSAGRALHRREEMVEYLATYMNSNWGQVLEPSAAEDALRDALAGLGPKPAAG